MSGEIGLFKGAMDGYRVRATRAGFEIRETDNGKFVVLAPGNPGGPGGPTQFDNYTSAMMHFQWLVKEYGS